MEEGVGVSEVPNTTAIAERVRTALEECMDGDLPGFSKAEVGLDRILVFGSYARGGALKGESDLDILLTLELSEAAPKTVATTYVQDCMLDQRKGFIEGFEEWFDGVDIIALDAEEAKIDIMDAFGDRLSGRREPTPTHFYDLERSEQTTLA